MRVDAVVIGAGHNGLTSAAYLARAGRSVLVLERSDHIGGAARSDRVFPAHDARLSAYSYLVSLLPQQIIDELGLQLDLRRRRISSYTPVGDGGILVDNGDPARTAADLGPDAQAWEDFYGMTGELARRLFPTVTQPLRSREDVRALVGATAWEDVFERPLGEALERRFTSDTVRGIALTDGLIGTFAGARERDLLANRCFLYHVIGRGTGDWDVPVGGMGAVTDGLLAAAEAAGAQVRTSTTVTGISTDGTEAVVRTADGEEITAGLVFSNAAPSVLAGLLGEAPPGPAPEGAQLKVNMLLSRLPALRDDSVTPEQAFAGTFHINEGYQALEAARAQAGAGQIPDLPPCEVYCHSLSDDSILGPDLVAAGAQTLTLFGLHMPARLFREDPEGARERALAATLASIDSVLAEPIEDCLLDEATIEVRSPLDIESSVGMPGGHIFHGDLQWPFAETTGDVGRWGVETAYPNVFVCGAGARRGGGVSGIPGRNAVAAALGEEAVG
ncbi:phytoene desaturase family protein [Ornithinicoccus hortensis]|uniref:Pyridine nucleotide-disulfide oxidoreductase domain-containing protein 2 n=1 Tax=Ornithinicoccus hortensis TaxID=82346 RepID=A0A542YRL6_9MICO|nr:NAD(P)/FAD-dependent oxidoreductase [Ornithinicoccus hortensis]TQL50745.1 phytoene dehydrogenase-like protein [Ornithinicoccus hortensis]